MKKAYGFIDGQIVTGVVAAGDRSVVERFVDRIIEDAISRNAEAIRVTTDSGGSSIEYSIDGEWTLVDKVRIEFSPQVINRFKLLAGIEYWKQDLRQSGTHSVTIGDVRYEVRLTFLTAMNYPDVLGQVIRPDAVA